MYLIAVEDIGFPNAVRNSFVVSACCTICNDWGTVWPLLSSSSDMCSRVGMSCVGEEQRCSPFCSSI